MKDLDENYDWKKNPEAETEYNVLKARLLKLEMCPEESVGMRRLKKMSDDEKRKAFEIYAVPRIKDAQKGEGHKGFIEYWKDMTFEKWATENADAFLEHDKPKEMEGLPRTFGAFQSFAGWMSFRGKCIGYCDLLTEDLQNEAYNDIEPEEMLDYARRLEAYSKQWEKDNPEIFKKIEQDKEKVAEWNKDNEGLFLMNEEQREKHMKQMKDKYGNEFIGFRDCLKDSNYSDYEILVDAILWLRFWAEKGHSMHAWY